RAVCSMSSMSSYSLTCVPAKVVTDSSAALAFATRGSRFSRIAVWDFGEGAVSLEGKAILWMRLSQVWWFGRGFIGLAQLERPEQAEFEAGEQQGGAGLEGAGGGLMQDAQQHEGDQRDIDLDLDGV